MAFWNRFRRREESDPSRPSLHLPDDPSKTRIYPDEVDPDWEDPVTEEDFDDPDEDDRGR